MGTAEELPADFYAMPDHWAIAVFATGRYRLNRTLEAIERVPMTCSNKFKALVVFVPANLALSHDALPLAPKAPSNADMSVDVG